MPCRPGAFRHGAPERVGVVTRHDIASVSRVVVVGPERHRIAVAFVDARLDAALESGNRGVERGESGRELDLEARNLTADMGDPSEDVTWEEAHRELVRVVEHDGVVGTKARSDGDRDRRCDGTRDVGSLHSWSAATCVEPAVTVAATAAVQRSMTDRSPQSTKYSVLRVWSAHRRARLEG